MAFLECFQDQGSFMWRRVKRLWKWLRRRFRRKNRVDPMDLSAPVDLYQPAQPISFPLESLDQLMDKSVFASFYFPFQQGSVPLLIREKDEKKKSKLLVCHDMKGGYQDDRFVQGDGNYNAYSLWHWQCIDVFVYFSHTLVTIPPPCWINAGHRHGVQVLGTFITEWDRGAQICKDLLESKDTAKMYASRLAEVAQKFRFDGWLINIENVIETQQIDTLVVFLSELTKEMHERVSNSLVIWYDAVTVDGVLTWQNALNDKNKRFFDVCDGIFINYTWKREYAPASANVAGDRASDVYMGVDVFGRNTYGGGGFDSNVALKVALEAGVSAALFAPGWVYEKNIGPTFEDAQIKFWASIHNVWPVAHRSPVVMPFFSDFSQGFGKAFSIDNGHVSESPWNNISCQTIQPLLDGVLHPEFEVSVRSVDPVYSGGSSLRFLGTLRKSEVRIAKLYKAHLALSNSSLFVDFSVLSKGNSVFYLVLQIQDHAGIHILFLSSEPHQNETNFVDQGASFTALKPKVAKGLGDWKLSDFQVEVELGSVVTNVYGLSAMKGDPPNFKEITKYLKTEAGATNLSHRLNSLLDSSPTQPYEVHLGYLRITDSLTVSSKVLTFQAADLKWSKNSGGMSISVTLKWQFKDNLRVDRCNIYVKMVDTDAKIKYLGVAFVNAFYVDSLLIDRGASSLRFCLQPRDAAGHYQNLDESPSLIIKLPTKLE